MAVKKHIKIIKDGHSICIFPEARKTDGKQEVEPKGGVAFLSFATNKPIIPVRIDGAIEKNKIILSFGKPLFPEDLFTNPQFPKISKDNNDYKKAAKLVMQKIREI